MSKITTEVYENVILKGIKKLPSDEVKELAKYVQFLYINREAEEFGRLVERTRVAAERRGYSLKDVSKLIKEVRKRK